MAGELGLVENELVSVGVEQPIGSAWCGNRRGPEGIEKLLSLYDRFARRVRPTELGNHAHGASLACEAKLSPQTNPASPNRSSSQSAVTRSKGQTRSTALLRPRVERDVVRRVGGVVMIRQELGEPAALPGQIPELHHFLA